MIVIKCGTKAFLGNIEGWVGCIEISFTNVLYQFEYIDRDMNHKSTWVHEQELKFEKPTKQKIGFKNLHN